MPGFFGQRLTCSEENQLSKFDDTLGTEPATELVRQGRGKACELCGCGAVFYCQADKAHLCSACDASVHSANFIVSWHIRMLLCFYCGGETSWRSCGPSVRPERAVCHRCVQRSVSNMRVHDNGEHDEGRVHALAASSSSEHSESSVSGAADRTAIARKMKGGAWHRLPVAACGDSQRLLPTPDVVTPLQAEEDEQHLKTPAIASDCRTTTGCKPHIALWAPSRIVAARRCGKVGGENDSWLRLKQLVTEEEGSCVTGDSSSSSGVGSEKVSGDDQEEVLSCGHGRKRVKLAGSTCIKFVEGRRESSAIGSRAIESGDVKLRLGRKRTIRMRGMRSGWS